METTTNKENTNKQNTKEKERTTTLEGALSDILDEYVCPITLELPLDPVTAEDGRVYERSAIEEMIQRHEGPQQNLLRSPTTNEKMGIKLLPSAHVRNVIETALQSGVLPKDRKVAEKWITKLEEDKQIIELKEKVGKNDVHAMYNLGLIYEKRDEHQEAYSCYRKAVDLGDVYSMAAVGEYLTYGKYGIEQNISEGFALLGGAAGFGSNFAAKELGDIFKGGKFGVAKNLEIAKFWYVKAVDDNCTYDHMDDDDFKNARSMLEELQKKSKTL